MDAVARRVVPARLVWEMADVAKLPPMPSGWSEPRTSPPEPRMVEVWQTEVVWVDTGHPRGFDHRTSWTHVRLDCPDIMGPTAEVCSLGDVGSVACFTCVSVDVLGVPCDRVGKRRPRLQVVDPDTGARAVEWVHWHETTPSRAVAEADRLERWAARYTEIERRRVMVGAPVITPEVGRRGPKLPAHLTDAAIRWTLAPRRVPCTGPRRTARPVQRRARRRPLVPKRRTVGGIAKALARRAVAGLTNR